MKRDYRNIAFWIIIILIICMSVWLIYYVNTQSYQCLSNPLVYGVGLYKDTGGEFTCTCSSPNSKIILVTKDNMSLRESKYSYLLSSSEKSEHLKR